MYASKIRVDVPHARSFDAHRSWQRMPQPTLISASHIMVTADYRFRVALACGARRSGKMRWVWAHSSDRRETQSRARLQKLRKERNRSTALPMATSHQGRAPIARPQRSAMCALCRKERRKIDANAALRTMSFPFFRIFPREFFGLFRERFAS